MEIRDCRYQDLHIIVTDDHHVGGCGSSGCSIIMVSAAGRIKVMGGEKKRHCNIWGRLLLSQIQHEI